MRRFIENSEGDSIFNYDRDMLKAAKQRKKLGEAPRETFYKNKEQVAAESRNQTLNKMLERYRSSPDEKIKDEIKMNMKRM